jgi:hypothetical protein
MDTRRRACTIPSRQRRTGDRTDRSPVVGYSCLIRLNQCCPHLRSIVTRTAWLRKCVFSCLAPIRRMCRGRRWTVAAFGFPAPRFQKVLIATAWMRSTDSGNGLDAEHKTILPTSTNRRLSIRVAADDGFRVAHNQLVPIPRASH